MDVAVAFSPRLLPANGDDTQLSADERAHRSAFPVALVSTPWAYLRPQLQLGLLAAIGHSHGFPKQRGNIQLNNQLPPGGQLDTATGTVTLGTGRMLRSRSAGFQALGPLD
jgi:hypothetical protein